MRLTVLGCAGSFPGPDGPASSYLLEVGGFRVVLDLGNGALTPLQRHGHLYDVDAVLLSHLHADHCLDLCAYYVARKYGPQGPEPRIPVYAPQGAEQRIADAYRDLPEGDLATVFEFRTWTEGTHKIGPLRVTARHVTHPVEAFALRIEHGGRVLVYSGDSSVSDDLVEIAREADLFLCEASLIESFGLEDGIHLTGRQAGEHATKAGVRRLVLTHIPAWTPADQVLAETRETWSGPLDQARPDAVYDV